MSAFGCKPANLESTQWEALCFNGDISNRKLAHETTKKRQKGDFLRGGGFITQRLPEQEKQVFANFAHQKKCQIF